MGHGTLHILALFDLPFPPPTDHNYSSLFKSKQWKDERDVIRALKRLNHKVTPLGLFDSIEPLLTKLQGQNPPDIVFNLCESFQNRRGLEANLIGLLELTGIPYTGANPRSLEICKDKGLTKKILAYHNIDIPRFTVARVKGSEKDLNTDFAYPVICKPLGLDGSEGISQGSFAKNETECKERIKLIHDHYQSDAIVEEYVHGREIYISVIGHSRLTTFPPREIFFHRMPKNRPKFATYRAKWDESYRRRWGIRNGDAGNINAKTLNKMYAICRETYRHFELSGYARMDFRLAEDDKIYFIEANPNPAISHDDDFAKSAERGGLSYDKLIEKILNLALQRAA